MNDFDIKKERNNLLNNLNNINTLPHLIKIKNYNNYTRNIYSKRNYKSFGQLLIDRKKQMKDNKNKIHNTFHKILDSLNESLYLSELVKQTKPKYDSINIKALLSPKILEKIKKEKYNKKWHLYETYSSNFNKSKSVNNIKKNSIKNLKYVDKKNKKGEETPFRKTQLTSKRLLPPQVIVKLCKKKIYNDNQLMKYSLYLNNNIDYYIESQEQNSGFYDFDKQLRKMIKETKIGIDFPGNSMQRNVLTYIKTINPKNITSKHTKNYSVPDRTFVPKPNNLFGKKFSYITKSDVYNYRNIIY